MAKIQYADKSQTGAYDAAEYNAQDANEVKTSVNALYDVVGSYKSYVAVVGYNGSNFNQTIVLQNNLGGTPVWSNTGTGTFKLTLAGKFKRNKTVAFTSGYNQFMPSTMTQSSNDDEVEFLFYKFDGGLTTTPFFDRVSVEIRVYD